MPRLDAETWGKIRAEYEATGMSYGDLAKKYNVTRQSIFARSKNEKWQQGKNAHIVDDKVDAVKKFAAAQEAESYLTNVDKLTIDEIVSLRLQEQGVLTTLSIMLASKAQSFAQNVSSISDLESLSRVKKNLTPPQAAQTQVTVQQAALSQSRADTDVELSAEDICDQLIDAQEREEKDRVEQAEEENKKREFMRVRGGTKKAAHD